ncbi:uncharacterized protein [Dipodomys merriami]|uniref:uncharacterized protein n=1 Tax=Dipodomys merriami TaxID=94247 RepID=UPI00384CE25C
MQKPRVHRGGRPAPREAPVRSDSPVAGQVHSRTGHRASRARFPLPSPLSGVRGVPRYPGDPPSTHTPATLSCPPGARTRGSGSEPLPRGADGAGSLPPPPLRGHPLRRRPGLARPSAWESPSEAVAEPPPGKGVRLPLHAGCSRWTLEPAGNGSDAWPAPRQTGPAALETSSSHPSLVSPPPRKPHSGQRAQKKSLKPYTYLDQAIKRTSGDQRKAPRTERTAKWISGGGNYNCLCEGSRD